MSSPNWIVRRLLGHSGCPVAAFMGHVLFVSKKAFAPSRTVMNKFSRPISSASPDLSSIAKNQPFGRATPRVIPRADNSSRSDLITAAPVTSSAGEDSAFQRKYLVSGGASFKTARTRPAKCSALKKMIDESNRKMTMPAIVSAPVFTSR